MKISFSVQHENKWYPGFIKEVIENIFFVTFVTVTVINVYTYNKYLELQVSIYSNVRFQGTFATTAANFQKLLQNKKMNLIVRLPL